MKKIKVKFKSKIFEFEKSDDLQDILDCAPLKRQKKSGESVNMIQGNTGDHVTTQNSSAQEEVQGNKQYPFKMEQKSDITIIV